MLSVDAATFLVLPLVLLSVGLLLRGAGVAPRPAMVNLIGAIAIVLPATAWQVCWELARGTPGKLLRGLRVVDYSSAVKPRPTSAVVREVVRVALPWELGHAATIGLANSNEPSAGCGSR